MNRYFISALIACTVVAFAGVASQGLASEASKHQKEINEAKATIADFEKKDPSLKQFFGSSYGYVVFSKIGKGGFIVGGAHGKGVVFKNQQMVGFASVIQGTVGLQIGGQTFKEIIFLENDKTFDNFTKNKVELAAQASAVAVKSGAGATAKYEDGVAIFTAGEKGFMAEAAVGGQKFKYEPAM